MDYDAVRINSDVHMKGLFLREGEVVESIDTVTGRAKLDQLEDERQFEATEIERRVTAPDSTRKIVKEFLVYASEHEKRTGRFPKTLAFACNDLPHTSHADALVNALRDECGRGDAFVQKITGSPTVDRPLQRIREFRNRETPAVVVTVDMLSTGVDVPAIEAILFLRPVKSRILFEQMLGRGTRMCPDIHKTHFKVFDAIGVLDYFKKASDFTFDPPEKPTRPTREVIEALRDNRDRAYNLKVLVRRFQRIAKNVSTEGRERFAAFIPEGDVETFARDLPRKLEEDRTGTLRLLTDRRFQDLLEDYPKPPRTFLVATEVEDVVTSEYMFRTGDGRELKIEDYIEAFQRFVRENPERVEALEILLRRPREFHTRELSELRKKLAARPERFTEPNLRKAYQKELADIISIIKHAVTGEPLLSAPERVARAMARVRKGNTFTPAQAKWLEHIQNYLTQNLMVEREDFEGLPFSREGGWKRANADFGGRLESLLTRINEAMVT